MTGVSQLFLDTNILVYATNTSSPLNLLDFARFANLITVVPLQTNNP